MPNDYNVMLCYVMLCYVTLHCIIIMVIHVGPTGVSPLYITLQMNDYKDFRRKDGLWQGKAVDTGIDVVVLKTWYRSIRTRYTRLEHRKSGDGASELTVHQMPF